MSQTDMDTIAALTARFPHSGRLDWIGLRPARRVPMAVTDTAEVTFNGLVGDRRASPGKRAVTLIQAEHLPVIAALAHLDMLSPDTLRRNLVVSGLNLSATRNRILKIGSAQLRITGPCAPCSRMEETLGPGGYNAMRGHGGWTAAVLTPGIIHTDDSIRVVA